ncbi:hypothetical protein BGW38_004802 [Lunasporangiospora selenospora]|uniref:Chitin-binding type-4 domain-containing protein n=1 Tax=Lunasporangiospora selenospora TaxID=979761 RepID=A0A9P6G127_9FUNG|nr:hypothetical protein BGW38_004802 [Lunasporangiospora selenospora]
MIRTCLQGTVPADSTKYTIPVQIPEGAPSGNVTLQWIWHNAIGQREIYSNCADLIIEGKNGAQGSVSGVEPLYANYYPDSPIIPEFSTASNPDSHELFDKRKSGSSTFGPLSRPILPFATAILVPLLGLSGLV